MSSLEWIAAALGLVCVALAVRRNLWTYAFGVVSTGMLAFVVFEAKLYSQALLQLFFVAINAYGFVNWRRAKADVGEVAVERMRGREVAAWLAGGVVATLAWGLAMDRLTDAAQPFGDAAIVAVSIAAQLLMAQRKLENWLLWILVNICYVPLLIYKNLNLYALLYAILVFIALKGFLDWRKTYREQTN